MRTVPLNKRKQFGKSLKSPFDAFPGPISWSNWKDEHLLNMLWACTLTGSLERTHYLELFREVSFRAREHLKDSNHPSLCHNYLATLSQEAFQEILNPLTHGSEEQKAIAAVKMVENLPDTNHWNSIGTPEYSEEELWHCMASGVFKCLDHQSQESTDVRWLKLILLGITGKLVFPESMSHHVDELRLYPDYGDMRVVRPFIRSTEMTTRMMEVGPDKPENVPTLDAETIWSEIFAKTNCIATPINNERRELDREQLVAELESIINEVIDHFMSTIDKTSVDARFDASFGLSLYALSVTFELAHIPSHIMASGRSLLRSIVECFITLAYLRHRDDADTWMEYRRYGSGQTALAFLKTSNLEATPDYINLERLEALANEDVWFETEDIKLGSWANKSIRSMAEDASVKDVYDRYFDWTSGFIHGHWGAVRDSVFTTCLNPLHRLHRIPHPMQPMPTVLVDCCKISNRLLDELNALYPGYSRRITAHKAAPNLNQSNGEAS